MNEIYDYIRERTGDFNEKTRIFKFINKDNINLRGADITWYFSESVCMHEYKGETYVTTIGTPNPEYVEEIFSNASPPI